MLEFIPPTEISSIALWEPYIKFQEKSIAFSYQIWDVLKETSLVSVS